MTQRPDLGDGATYRIGVLLSSSNASTWTAHQDRDLKFRLLACRFTENTRTVPLGNITVTDSTDLSRSRASSGCHPIRT